MSDGNGKGIHRCSITREGEDRCSVTGKVRKVRIFVLDSIIRKIYQVVNRGENITVILSAAKNRGSSKVRTGHGWWHGKGGLFL